MDLILWRHAEAEDPAEGRRDHKRALTARGHKQARRMAAWLDRQLPENARILCSPALRCQQTALELGRKYKTCPELALINPAPDTLPSPTPDTLLALAGWPRGKSATVLVGHQPMLGLVIAQLTGMGQTSCPLRKGALWWFRAREREGQLQTLIITVQSPEMV